MKTLNDVLIDQFPSIQITINFFGRLLRGVCCLLTNYLHKVHHSFFFFSKLWSLIHYTKQIVHLLKKKTDTWVGNIRDFLSCAQTLGVLKIRQILK